MFGIGEGIANLGRTYENIEQRKYQDRINKENRDRQDRSIQIKTADAKAAGIHPLYALGAPTLSPTSVAAQQNMNIAVPDIDRSIKEMGQGKMNSLQTQMAAGQLDGIDLDNAAKKQQLELNQMEIEKTKKTMLNPRGSGKDLLVGGTKVDKNKQWSDAQDIEDRYGDVVSWMYGAGVLGADFYETSSKQKGTYNKEKLEKARKEYFQRGY